MYLFEDWANRSGHVWSEIVRFLELDPAQAPDLIAPQHEGRLSYAAWEATLSAIRPWTPRVPRAWRTVLRRGLEPLLTYRPRLDPELRRSLTRILFRDDILRLQDVLRRDLSHWLSNQS